MNGNNLKDVDATASEIVQSVDTTVETSRADKIEENKRMLYNLNCNLQDVLFDAIKSYGELDKLELNSNVLDDSEIIQHKKLLISIYKKIELIRKYLKKIEDTTTEYDKFDLLTLKLEYEVANQINDFLVDNLSTEDIAVIDDDLSDMQWIKTKTDNDVVITKKFLKAFER